MNGPNLVCADPENPTNKEIFAGLMSLMAAFTRKPKKIEVEHDQQLVTNLKDVVSVPVKKPVEISNVAEIVDGTPQPEMRWISNKKLMSSESSFGDQSNQHLGDNVISLLCSSDTLKSTVRWKQSISEENCKIMCSSINNKIKFYSVKQENLQEKENVRISKIYSFLAAQHCRKKSLSCLYCVPIYISRKQAQVY